MIENLQLINTLPSSTLEKALKRNSKGRVFILKTCQRTLLIGFNNVPQSLLNKSSSELNIKRQTHEGVSAYIYLLNIICGLKSKIVGESEIVQQFKLAYHEFLNCTAGPNRLIQATLEKLFKDAKEIRTQYLTNLGLQTYAGLSRQIFLKHMRTSERKEVTVLGSGQLAEDFIKIAHKNFDIKVCARNQQRVQELRMKYSIEIIDWKHVNSACLDLFVLNTIGCEGPLIPGPIKENTSQTSQHINNTKLFIDLADITPFRHIIGKEYYFSLEEIFRFSKQYQLKSKQKIVEAQKAIEDIALRRKNNFIINHPFGWEELQFA